MRMKLLIGMITAVFAIGVAYAVNRHPHDRQGMVSSIRTITGKVVDAQGQPVSGAEVMALSDSGGMGRLPTAYTDEQGVFLFKHLAPDTYTLSVAKEEDGYAHTYIPLYSAGPTENTRATLSEQQTVSDITLRLGPKAAKLTGRILDASTNKPIKAIQDLQIVLRRASDPNSFYSTGPDSEGNFSILVPPVPFTIEVSAPGYKKWTNISNADGDRTSPVQMTQGEGKKVTIALQPIK